MAESNYWNFELKIAPCNPPVAGSYVVEAKSRGGEGQETIAWPFTKQEISDVCALVEGPARDAKRTGQVAMGARPDYRAKIKVFGERLFDAVFVGRIRSIFDTSLTLAQVDLDKPMGLRIRLRLKDVPEIAETPWEYLYNRDASRYLSIFRETPILRYMEIPQRIPAITTPLPIRVLVMIASPTDLAGLDTEQERKNIEEAFRDLRTQGLADVDVIETGTLDELTNRLDDPHIYHIFHFIGHGGFTAGQGEGVLYFQGDNGSSHEIANDVLLSQLRRNDKLCLAVLNSCDGAQAGAHDPFAGMAQHLVQGGIPAAIAMQFRITDKAAIMFASTFYEKLARGYTVDRALTDTRNKIFAHNPTEWGTPVLFMRTDDGRIFDLPTEEQIRQRRIDALSADAKAAIDNKDYLSAIQKLQDIQKLLQLAAPGN